MNLIKLILGATVTIAVAADVSPIKLHRNAAINEDLKKIVMSSIGIGVSEYEPFCAQPGQGVSFDACTDTNPYNPVDCDSLQLYSGYFLGCFESQCGPACELVPNQYQSYLELIEATVGQGDLVCDLGTACTIIDEATGGTAAPSFFSIPTSPPSPAPVEALCTSAQGELADACIAATSGYNVSNCEQLDYVVAGFVKCIGLYCGQSCEAVGAFLAPQVAAIGAEFGCDTPGDACQLTVSPSKSPSLPVITPFPTVADVPLTQFPSPAPVDAPTPLVTSPPIVSPTVAGPSTGTQGEFVAAVILAGLSLVIAVLIIALVIVLCMKKKQAVLEVEVKTVAV